MEILIGAAGLIAALVALVVGIADGVLTWKVLKRVGLDEKRLAQDEARLTNDEAHIQLQDLMIAASDLRDGKDPVGTLEAAFATYRELHGQAPDPKDIWA